MKTYLVGGAVRDEQLGLAITDRDWVVVGATPEQMLQAGYKPVGKDFPVFLHPDTHEEYALARTERKTAPGYHGFAFNTDSSVTLEDDLMRRDLTINAIARDDSGQLVDPFNGIADIENRVLRHVSPAFSEDPVRVLRVARFMARFAVLGFSVAPETEELMRSMVGNGEVSNLVAERVWQELHGALQAESPRDFFLTLHDCGALAVILPELDCLFGVPQPPQWHPEIDAGIHTMMVLDQTVRLNAAADVRFAAICHDLGKGVTPRDEWPSHRGHEKTGAEITRKLCNRLRVPKDFRLLAELVARYHLHAHRACELKIGTLERLLASLDVVRQPQRFDKWLQCCTADAIGRGDGSVTDYPQADYLQGAANAVRGIDAASIAKGAASNRDIPDLKRDARILALREYRKLWRQRQPGSGGAS